jgi:hypothetical protein
MWDAGKAGKYNRDIAGIGRDDMSAFNQRQSTSVNGDILTIGLGEIVASNQEQSSAFSSDLTFLSWGHNGGAVDSWLGTGEGAGAGVLRLPRVWKLQAVGGEINGGVIQVSALPASEREVFFLLDDDGNFTNGGTDI